jgi:ribosomal protein S18 acetylase RimI-like enzyme
LSSRTWEDFERLFRRKSKWGDCWCIIFHRPGPLPKGERAGFTKEKVVARNRRDKKDLVEKGHSHGTLVYSHGEPIGWCQYGPKEELPRMDAGRIYKKLSLNGEGKRLWRITCFWVDRRHRNRGVAAAGLNAALNSIRKKGGGGSRRIQPHAKDFRRTGLARYQCSRRRGSRWWHPSAKAMS